VIIVAGMHRSGTSGICNVLNGIGLDFGPSDEFLPTDQWNAKGYFERLDVFRLNTAIITGHRSLSSHWDTPAHERSRAQKFLMAIVKARYLTMPGQGRIDRRAARVQDRITERSAHLQGLAVKDPRFCLTLSQWSRFGHVSKVLFCHRHPMEVAHSLHTREGIPVALAYRFWAYHVRAFFAQADELGLTPLITDFGALLDPDQRDDEACKLFEWAGHEFDPTRWAEITERSLDSKLRHHRNNDAGAMPVYVQRLLDDILARRKQRFSGAASVGS
jgi:hypothetical protein